MDIIKKILIATFILIAVCSTSFADEGMVAIGEDFQGTLYAVMTDTVRQNKFYVSGEYLVLPQNRDLVNILIEDSNNPKAVASVIVMAYTHDFKYRQIIEMRIIDSEFNKLDYQKYTFDEKNYEIIKNNTIAYDIAMKVKEVIKKKK